MRLAIVALGLGLALAGCGQKPLNAQAASDAAADAAAVDNSVPAADPNAAGAASESDARGTQGTSPPDGSGQPGVTLPTTPPSDTGPADPTN
ncbi:MAG TPA: hypothetical protein VF559_13010 [Caulobacteraceae bacterium]|jgi:hypothetical protein